MQFPLNVYLIDFVVAIGISAAALPLWRKLCDKAGFLDSPGYRKIHHSPVPLAGGPAIITAFFLPVIMGCAAVFVGSFDEETTALIRHGFEQRAGQLVAIFGGVAGMFLLGGIDDRHELKPSVKFGGQLLISLIVAATGIRITLFVDNVLFSYAVTVLWILTLVNAFNFMDNMNGLCAGLGFIASVAFAIFAARAGQYLVTSLALLSAGALLGFLPYNFPKATAFLGDSGSHVVGFIMAVLAIMTTFYSTDGGVERSPWAVISPLLVLVVPLADLVMVVLIRRRSGQPFYIGDNNHVSHRLVKRGFSPKQAVLLLWTAAIAGAAVSFLF